MILLATACLATSCQATLLEDDTPRSDCARPGQDAWELMLAGDIADFRIPLAWRGDESACIHTFAVLRNDGQIGEPDRNTDELFATAATHGSDTVAQSGTYTYFLAGKLGPGITPLISPPLIVHVTEDGRGYAEFGDGSANDYERALFGSYDSHYDPGYEYANMEAFIVSFYEAYDGSPRMSFHWGYGELNAAYSPGGDCITHEYEATDMPYRATSDMIVVEMLDGTYVEMSYALDGEDLILDSEMFAGLAIEPDQLASCPEIDIDADLEMASDTTIHITVSADLASYSDDTMDSIMVDYGDGNVDSTSATGSPYEFYHDLELAGPSSEYVYLAVAETAGGLRAVYGGYYSYSCVAGDPYEENDASTEAVTVTVDGAPLELRLNDEQDWFAVDLSDGVQYQFRTYPNTVDTVMYLYDTDGSLELGFSDDTYDLAASISFTPSTSGTYYLAVMPYNAPQCESYTLELTTP